MARERYSLVPQEELKKEEIRTQIEQGMLTYEVFQTLTPKEQNKVREALFEMYAHPIDVPHALSGLEFAFFMLAKLFFRLQSGEPLNEQEQQFYDRLKEIIDQHEVALDPNAWYIPYVEEKMQRVLANRSEYKQKKIEITGSF